MPRIHITGASGSGTSTLGAALASALRAAHLDTDSFYWMPTDPPFTTKRPEADRLRLIREAMAPSPDNWILSGSALKWAEPLIPLYEAVIYLSVPTPVRMDRLAARERARYGAAIEPGGAMHQLNKDFMIWASRYDDDGFEGRSRRLHDEWLATLPCPVMRLDGTGETTLLVEEVLRRMGSGHDA